MPTENQSSRGDSNFKIIALIAAFLLVSLVTILFYYQNYMKEENKSDEKTTTETGADSSTSNNTTVTANGKTTYTSKSHNYSITYPESWTVVDQATSSDGSGQEIVLLNLKDNESRENGKPNIIIIAGVPEGFCAESPDCKMLSTNIIANYRANGDQASIDEVLNSFTTN